MIGLVPEEVSTSHVVYPVYAVAERLTDVVQMTVVPVLQPDLSLRVFAAGTVNCPCCQTTPYTEHSNRNIGNSTSNVRNGYYDIAIQVQFLITQLIISTHFNVSTAIGGLLQELNVQWSLLARWRGEHDITSAVRPHRNLRQILVHPKDKVKGKH